MATAYLQDRKQILPCAAYLEGEYGIDGVYFGVPVSIGAGGVERVIEIDLSEKEKQEMAASVGHVRELIAAMDGILADGA